MPVFKSGLEETIAEYLLPLGFGYEDREFNYILEKRYTPDFTKGNTIIECKGRFRTLDEIRKYKAMRDQHPDLKIIFVFQDPNKYMPGSKSRTMSEWADKEGFEWYGVNDVKELCK